MTESAPEVRVVVTPGEVWDQFVEWATGTGLLVQRMKAPTFYLLGLPVYAIMPGVELASATLDPADLLVDVYRSGTNEPVAVRVTHKPTGLVETSEGAGGVDVHRQAATVELARRVADPTVAP